MFAAVVLTAAFYAPAVRASETYPGVLQEQVPMPCVPKCTLCHTDDPGILLNFGAPFGQNLKESYGLILQNDDSLINAIEQARADGLDTDLDGKPDIEELQLGTDPNGSEEDICDVPRYGCGARIEPESPVDEVSAWFPIAVSVALGGLLLRRARAR